MWLFFNLTGYNISAIRFGTMVDYASCIYLRFQTPLYTLIEVSPTHGRILNRPGVGLYRLYAR